MCSIIKFKNQASSLLNVFIKKQSNFSFRETFAILLLIMLTISNASADDFYVDTATGINDTAHGKSPYQPWNTLGYAFGVNGLPRTGSHNLYVRAGTYTEFNNTYMFGAYSIIGCDSFWNPSAADVIFKPSGTGNICLIITTGDAASAGPRRFYGITFDNNGATTGALLKLAHSSPAAGDTIVEYCNFKSTTGVKAAIDCSLSTNMSVTVSNCAFNNDLVLTDGTGTTLTFRIVKNVDVNNNVFSCNTGTPSGFISDITAAADGTAFSIHHNTLITSVNLAGHMIFTQSARWETADIHSNNFINTNTSWDKAFIRFDSSTRLTNILIDNNDMSTDITGTHTYGCIQINLPTAASTGIQRIAGNTIASKATGGYIINIGAEGTVAPAGDNNLHNVLVEKNKIHGVFYFNPATPSATTHGVFTGWTGNATYRYNYLNGCPYGLLMKGGSTTNSHNADGTGIYGNIITNTKSFYAIGIKGYNGVNCYNNTIYTTLDHGNLVALITNGSQGVYNFKFKNNIVAGKDNHNLIYIESGCAGGAEFDYNYYYNQAGTDTADFDIGGLIYSSFTSYKTDNPQGFDFNSYFADPAFVDSASGTFCLKTDSPCIDSGTNLGNAYDDAIKCNSTWPGEIHTDSQTVFGSGWEIGAYIEPADNGTTTIAQTTSTVFDSTTTSFEPTSTTSLHDSTSTTTTAVQNSTTTVETDTDNDGIADSTDNCPAKPNGPNLGTCSATSDKPNINCTSDADCANGCSSNGLCIKDQRDADNDGVGDVCDCAPLDNTKFMTWTVYVDADGDGHGAGTAVNVCGGATVPAGHSLTNDDGCPNDPAKTVPDICGCGVADIDTDADGILDCLDNCKTTPNGPLLGICMPGSDKAGSTCHSDAECVNGCSTNGKCSLNQEDTNGDGKGDVCSP